MKIRQLILCASTIYAQGTDILRDAYQGNFCFFFALSFLKFNFMLYNLSEGLD